MSEYASLGHKVGCILDVKQTMYGDSFHKCGAVLRTLYPNGIPIEQYDNVLYIARMLDKMFRLATGNPADQEDPIKDMAGYSLLMCKK